MTDSKIPTNQSEGELPPLVFYGRSPEAQAAKDAEVADLDRQIAEMEERKRLRQLQTKSDTLESIRESMLKPFETTLKLRTLINSDLFLNKGIDSDTQITRDDLINDLDFIKSSQDNKEGILRIFDEAVKNGRKGGEAINPYRGNNVSKLITALRELAKIEDGRLAKELYGSLYDEYIANIETINDLMAYSKNNRVAMPIASIQQLYDISVYINDKLIEYEKSNK